MTKKQKTVLYRIIAAAIIYIPLFVLEHMGKLEFQTPWPVKFLLFLVPYAIIGWDIIYKAIRNICHGQVFDENFLMCIATFGALGVGEYCCSIRWESCSRVMRWANLVSRSVR